jgi:hypothetical protein
VTHGVETWVAAFLTLCFFSFLYKDNPFYRFAEHLFVGASAGYLLAVEIQNVLLPNVFVPLLHNQHHMIELIPLTLGLLMLSRAFDRTAGWSRWAMAFYVGIYSGIAIPGYVQGFIIAQLADAAKPFAHGWAMIGSVLVLVGFLTVLAYFFFSAPHAGAHGIVARIGVFFLMIAFGASFGYTVMARVSLLISRVQFLLRDWLHLLPMS